MHQLAAVRAPHPLVLEGPQSALEALLIVTRHRHATEAQALADLQWADPCVKSIPGSPPTLMLPYRGAGLFWYVVFDILAVATKNVDAVEAGMLEA